MTQTGPGHVNLVDSQPPEEPDPADPTRQEIIAALNADASALGDVWRRQQAGETNDQIQLAIGLQNPNFIRTCERAARAVVEGEIPTAPSVAQHAARAIRRVLRAYPFSAQTRATLEERLEQAEAVAGDLRARGAEEALAREATLSAEHDAQPGVYVYALPHYIRHPFDEASGRTLVKVGRADNSVIRRFREQARTTALPEDPILLRIYVTAEAEAENTERSFHRLLDAADHDHGTARAGGSEWFLSSVRFLDEVANVLGLETRVVSDSLDIAD